MASIKGTSKPVKEIFHGEFEYTIPDYQRPYAWKETHCEQLWDDLVNFWRESGEGKIDRGDGKDEYFLGIIMFAKDVAEGDGVYYVIDGQQRLITLSLLLKALQEVADAHGVTLTEKLEQRFSKEGKLRIKFEAKQRENDNNKLQRIITSGAEDKSADSGIRINYHIFKQLISKWYDEEAKKNSEDLNSLIGALLNKVTLFRIECNSQDQALTIFETLNDRGLLLSDADIFKVKIYTACLEDTQDKRAKDEIVERWDKLDSHEWLFRIYLEILRAKDEEDDLPLYKLKEVNMRRFFLKDKKAIWKEYQKIIFDLEILCHINREEWDIPASIYKWWKILAYAPSQYWCDILFFFLYKNFDKTWDEKAGKIKIEKGSKIANEFQELIEWTVRYFYIRGALGNLTDDVKETTYKVCRAIHRGEDYLKIYRESLEHRDYFNSYKHIIDAGTNFRYWKGIVLVIAALNKDQDDKEFCESFKDPKGVEAEHILPEILSKHEKYENWDEVNHQRYRGWLGNLVACEGSINRKVRNRLFRRKQEEYKKSKIRDLLDLAGKKDGSWMRKDIMWRDRRIKERLRDFFVNDYLPKESEPTE